MIDDSDLFHANRRYDPVKAREYYLRTRKLKGRKKGSSQDPPAQSKSSSSPANGWTGKKSTTDRERLLQRKAELEARVEKLRKILEEALKNARKNRESPPNPKGKAEAAPETKAATAARNKAEKGSKPLTSSQKREKAKKAKEAYEKENRLTLSEDVEVLEAQIKDLRKRIKKALEQSKERNSAGKTKAAIVQRPDNKKSNNRLQGR